MIPEAWISLFNHLWQSTTFAAAAAGLVLLLRRHGARVRYWVWLAALLKFFIPVSWLIEAGESARWRTAPVDAKPLALKVAEPFEAPIVSPPRPLIDRRNARWTRVMMSVWALGTLGVSLLWLSRWRTVRKAVAVTRPLAIRTSVPVLSSPMRIEPGVYGLFRPVLIVPEAIESRLTPAQLEAVITHEMCHVRYRDNLTATALMLAESVFWFHPLVWWIGARLLAERERACDEEVLRSGTEPSVYAEAILSVCKLYVESPIAWVSGVTGANLKQRIADIMENRVPQQLGAGKRLSMALAGGAAILAPLAIGVWNAPPLRAQQAIAPNGTSFEVATIKPSQPGILGGGFGLGSSGRWIAHNASLEDLVWAAYGTGYWHKGMVLGVPTWAKSARFDISAQPEKPVTPAQIQLMIASLLAERFRLKVHRETRELPAYALVVSRSDEKTRARLRPTASEEAAFCEAKRTALEAAVAAGKEPDTTQERLADGSRRCGSSSGGGTRLSFRAVRIADFIETLTEVVDRVIVDQTGLGGYYDIDVELEQPFEFEHIIAENAPDALDSNSSVFQVLQEQLGLKLESTRAATSVFVIDASERPSEN